jgi:hypothetical protein
MHRWASFRGWWRWGRLGTSGRFQRGLLREKTWRLMLCLFCVAVPMEFCELVSVDGKLKVIRDC